MRPNIVLILLDAARADALSCYGNSNETTPFVDSLAESGVRYERAYSNSIWSLPAYGSLFTGKYPSQHGAVDWNQRINENSLVDGLNDEGYATKAVSSHLVCGEFGIADAFDELEWVSVPDLHMPFPDDPVIGRIQERKQGGGWDSKTDFLGDVAAWTASEGAPQTVVNGIHHVYRRLRESRGWWRDDGATDIVDSMTEFAQRTPEPFFLFGNFVETHGPYRPPREHIRRFVDDDVAIAEMNETIEIDFIDVILGDSVITDRQRRILRDLYDAELYYLDTKIAELHRGVADAGVLENTVFVVMADHGDLFGEWGLWGHQGAIHPDLARVPLVISYPWEASAVETEPIGLERLHDHLLDIGTGTRTGHLPASGGAFIEYHGWDTHQATEPWTLYENQTAQEWGLYEAALVSEEYMLRWRANGDRFLYGCEDPQHSLVYDEHPKISETMCKRIKVTLGDPEQTHAAYRHRAGDTSDLFGDKEGDVADRLEHLGYL